MCACIALWYLNAGAPNQYTGNVHSKNIDQSLVHFQSRRIYAALACGCVCVCVWKRDTKQQRNWDRFFFCCTQCVFMQRRLTVKKSLGNSRAKIRNKVWNLLVFSSGKRGKRYWYSRCVILRDASMSVSVWASRVFVCVDI